MRERQGIKKAKKVAAKSFNAQSTSDKKANRTLGSRKSAIGAIAGAVRRRSSAGKVGAKAGGIYRMTAAHKKAIGDALRGKKRR